MNYDNFYILHQGCQRNALRVSVEDSIVTGEELKQIFLGKNIRSPVEFIYDCGKVPYDFILGSYVDIVLVSSRLFDILKSCNLTGWSVYPVIVQPLKNTNKIYWGLQVTGRCGSTEFKFGADANPFPCFTPFDLNSWDGSDFFCPEGTTLCLLTERVVSCFRQYKVTNVSFDRFSDKLCR